jgi:hypothetical protein
MPAKFRVIVTRRPKYAYRKRDGVIQAPTPSHIIESGIPTEALLAQIAVIAQNVSAAHTKIRFTAGHRFGDVDIGTSLTNTDVESCISVETLVECRVVAC